MSFNNLEPKQTGWVVRTMSGVRPDKISLNRYCAIWLDSHTGWEGSSAGEFLNLKLRNSTAGLQYIDVNPYMLHILMNHVNPNRELMLIVLIGVFVLFKVVGLLTYV